MQETLTIQLPTNESAIALSGANEENLRYISRMTSATLVMRGQDLVISGQAEYIDRAAKVVNTLEPDWSSGKAITIVDIQTVLQVLNSDRGADLEHIRQDVLAKSRKGEVIRAKTLKQQQYVQSVRKHDLTFCIGPAGTGKTYLAAVLAVQALLANQFERLILTRPAVEAGEKLGFLPGDLQEKVNPYLRPIYDALHEFVDPDKITGLIERQVIEIAPIAYMRGRTLSNAFVIVDEAQNTTAAQMKMLLTRIGQNSKMVVTGDITQTDLPRHEDSGLAVAEKILSNVEGIAFCRLNRTDVVRHPLVQRIVEAYDKHGQ
ncbi:PhoH family protein [filamentous cyanobacterium LEGE 11480]|uniref:PhoH-like protein n=1 Tax=Romeriopsis navalis LEGE 11480 TaxID=2777977 RepID=A0A928VMA4_9CYAN|nr:PhoH family protein [Romeriopsis navalis]MBE9028604.1 PhoH family protein [Romeriopsis navalis LEGE 11480]